MGGDVDLATVQALAVEHFDLAGKLGAISIDESKIPETRRLPRVTVANWYGLFSKVKKEVNAFRKYANGAVCSFTHNIILHGTKYETAMDIYCDGWQLRLVDLYNNPALYVRSPANE